MFAAWVALTTHLLISTTEKFKINNNHKALNNLIHDKQGYENPSVDLNIAIYLSSLYNLCAFFSPVKKEMYGKK